MIKLPAILSSYRDKVDGSASLLFQTRELSDEDVLLLRNLRNLEGWLLFAERELQKEDVPEGDPDLERKSAAQRLRAVLFLRWKELGEPDTFESYYSKSMEYFINQVKDKLG